MSGFAFWFTTDPIPPKRTATTEAAGLAEKPEEK